MLSKVAAGTDMLVPARDPITDAHTAQHSSVCMSEASGCLPGPAMPTWHQQQSSCSSLCARQPWQSCLVGPCSSPCSSEGPSSGLAPPHTASHQPLLLHSTPLRGGCMLQGLRLLPTLSTTPKVPYRPPQMAPKNLQDLTVEVPGVMAPQAAPHNQLVDGGGGAGAPQTPAELRHASAAAAAKPSTSSAGE